MKITRFSLNLVKLLVVKSIKKRRKGYPPFGVHQDYRDIPYIDDGNVFHKYDIYLAKKKRKNICIIDIHGGSYILSESYDNYPFANEFLKCGYDIVAVDYLPNNGERDTLDLISDAAKCINHLQSHLKDYGLENDEFVICGDSAGGHIALIISEAIISKEIRDKLNLDIKPFPFKAILVNSPVYDFALSNFKDMSKGALKRMFGPHIEEEHFALLSPRSYIDVINVPIFLSTCNFDFIRQHTLTMKEDLLKKNKVFTFVDILSKEKEVDHVHNVTKPHLKESYEVNYKMMEFIDEYTK